MSYKVKVENGCSCFLKSGLAQVQEFETEEKAKEEAEYILGVMNSTFCHKHEFSLNEQFGDFSIYIKARA